MPKSNKSQSKNALINLVTELIPTKHNNIPISRLVLWALDRDYEATAIFTQCMYWADGRSALDDGWFWKSYDEWYDDTLIQESCARRKIKKLEDKGWIQTMIWQVYGTPKLHIRVLTETVTQDLVEAAEKFLEEKAKREEKKEKDLAKRRDRNQARRAAAETTGIYGSQHSDGIDTSKLTGSETSKTEGSIYTEITNRDYKTEITEYPKSVSTGNAYKDGLDSKTNPTTSGKVADQAGQQHGLAGSKKEVGDGSAAPMSGERDTEEDENEIAKRIYKTPWKKGEPLRRDPETDRVYFPPANKWKMPRFTATRLAQYIFASHIFAEDDFQMMYQEPGKGESNKVWVYDEYGWFTEDESFIKSQNLSMPRLRNRLEYPEYDYDLDCNEVLESCWEAAQWLWDRDDANQLFHARPLPHIFGNWLHEEWGVTCDPFDPDVDLEQ